MSCLIPSDYNEVVAVDEPWNSIDTTADTDILLDFLIACNLCTLKGRLEKMTLLKYPLAVNQLCITFLSLIKSLQLSVSFQCNPCQI